MSYPTRPALKPGDRQLSKVRFSRGDMEALPTTATDSTVHGVHHDPRFPRNPHPAPQSDSGEQQVYDVNGFHYGGEEIQPSDTRDMAFSDDGGYYQSSNEQGGDLQHASPYSAYQHREEIHEQQIQSNDGYTPPPARIGGKRYPGQSDSQPTYDAHLSVSHPMNDPYARADVSPRGSVICDASPTQPALLFHHQQQLLREQQLREQEQQQLEQQQQPQQRQRPQSQSVQPASNQNSPQPRASAIRPSMLMSTAGNGGRPRPPVADDGFESYTYPQNQSVQQIRASSPVVTPSTPPGRGVQQQRGSPMASPQFGASYGSPQQRQIPNPNVPYGQNSSPNFRRYDDSPDPRSGAHLSPVPPYQSARNSGARQNERGWQDQFDGRDQSEKRYSGQTDSDATLTGGMDYDNQKKGYPRPEKSFDNYSQRPSRPRSTSDASSNHLHPNSLKSNGEMHRRSTRQVEDGDDASNYHVKGGVFSQLLRLTGRSSAGMRRRQSSRMTTASTVGGDLPIMASLGLKRNQSNASTTFGGDELDPDDPRVTGQKKKKGFSRRRSSLGDASFGRRDSSGITLGQRGRRQSIQFHVTDILTRQQFILKLAKALMTFGAPSHRIESQLAATALVLEVDAQFIHFPSIVIASFGDMDTHTSETHFVKAGGGLDLGKLHKTHNIYRSVVHDELDAAEGTKKVHALLKAPSEFNLWQRMILAFLASAIIAPLGFGGSLIDGLASGCCGILLAFLQIHVSSKSAMYSNIFEISIATIISFAARGLSTTGLFCYQAVGSAGVVLILPGYTILCGSLELASKNIVSGSVRMVYAIIYSLFLGFGITIGSDLFYVIDQSARRTSNAMAAAANSVITLHGTFNPDNSTNNNSFAPFNGSFTFSNSTTDAVSSNLQQGSIICLRTPDLPWYRQSMPAIYLIALVPLFSIVLSLWNMQPIRSRQLPVMVIISCIGFATNTLANHYIFNRSDVVSAIGAFVIGILGNVYSRIFGGTAFTSMVTGVLFLVPSGIAAAGGLAMTVNTSSGDSYNQGLIIGFRMVQVAIGITVGLFGSGLLIYSFGSKKGTALFAF